VQPDTKFPFLGKYGYNIIVLILRQDISAIYFTKHAGDTGTRAATSSYRAWNGLTLEAEWKMPPEVQETHPKASILKAGRVVFNIKGNDYRLVCKIDYAEEIVEIRWFGSHPEYDKIDAETI
jgi:mRNA interferase HigB